MVHNKYYFCFPVNNCGLILTDTPTVKLSRSVQHQDTVPEAISDSVIYISDESLENFYLKGSGNGLYKTDSTEFLGVIGKTYVLHIQTAEGNIYESEPYAMEVVSDIDNIYYARDQEIIIYSSFTSKSDRVEGQNMSFIDPKKSDRLLLQYSILMKQYSVSEKEYDFWYNMKQINEKGGSIYSLQPFPVISNIHNIKDPEERFLGYFQVSAVKEKRKFITFSELSGMNFPNYRNQCKRVEMAPKDYPRSLFSPPLTWDDLYEMYSTSGYYFVEPFFTAGTEVLEKMVFAKPECSNCEITGIQIKPDYWIDFN